MDVIKRSGEKEAFDSSKIMNAVEKAMIDAGGLPDEESTKARDIVRDCIKGFERKGECQTIQIRKDILSRLDKSAKGVADSWRRFDKKYKIVG